MDFNHNTKQRLTQKEKDKNDFQWYKDQADLLDSHSFSENHFIGFGGVTEFKRKKVNYDLFNNIVNMQDFQYVCKPFGAEAGDLPAKFTNRDIVSGKIKVLIGMEMKMPFDWQIVAVNRDATTRKEETEFNKYREYVVNSIMTPLKESIQKQQMEQMKGKKLTPEEQQDIAQQIQDQVSQQTPDKVRKYMQREHQDPAEVLGTQILQYLVADQQIRDKFNKGFKHMCLSGTQVYHIGILNGEPRITVANPLFFDYDLSPDLDYIEDGEWAVHEYRMTPSEVVATFGSKLTEEEIDRIYEYFSNPSHIYNGDWTFQVDKRNEPYTCRVLHTTWKSVKQIGFLTFMSPITGKQEMKLVDENYKINRPQGDIKIEWMWIPEAHQVYKILDDIYVYPGPVPGQNKDLDNLWKCKLPYYGASVDSLNSPVTAPMDRIKAYQYYYDIILYRVELLMASDKGKKLVMNIKAIPKSAGIDLKKWLYYFEANSIAFLNPNEEGNRGGDVTNMVKDIDMSLVSKINEYIQLAEYIEKKCGSAIGVTPQMEAQIAPSEAVSNTQQNIVQAGYIIQPYFDLHNSIKGNALTGLLETAKVAYSQGQPKVLNYVLDDMTRMMLTVNQDLLENSRYGLFVSNSSKAADAKRIIEQLANSAMQNQMADLGDIIKVVRADSVTEADELLEAAQARKADEADRANRSKIQAQKEAQQREAQMEDDKFEHEKEITILKASEERKTKVQVATIGAMGYDVNKDEDDDGVPDVLEVAKFGVDADIKKRKEDRADEEFQHKKEVDNKKLGLEARKIAVQANKPKAS